VKARIDGREKNLHQFYHPPENGSSNGNAQSPVLPNTMIYIGFVEALVFIALGIGAVAGSRLAFWCLERFIAFDLHKEHSNKGDTARD
jgi:hypothetical protein